MQHKKKGTYSYLKIVTMRRVKEAMFCIVDKMKRFTANNGAEKIDEKPYTYFTVK